MKLKTFLLAAVLFMILIQTIMITYYGIDRLSVNIKENEKNNLMQIGYDFIKKVMRYEELKTPIDYFIRDPELRIKIILENRNQIKFLCDWFIKTAALNSLAISNHENKNLFLAGNKSIIEYQKKIFSSNQNLQSVLFDNKTLFAVYGCPIFDNKKTLGYISSFKEIGGSAITSYGELNKVKIIINEESDITIPAGSLKHSIEIKDISGKSIKISFIRDLSESSAMLERMKKNFIMISVSISIFVYLIGLIIIFRLTRSLRRLENCAARMAGGDFNFKINRSKIREVNSLIESFNKMSFELKKSQDYIIRQEKLNLAGKLAGGIAHELNNPLVAALGYTQILIEKCAETEDDKFKYLKNIEKNIIRGRAIVKSLLNYSSKKNVCKFETQIKPIIDECIQLVKYQADKKKITIDFLSIENRAIVTDRELLKQVIINIILNSIDALQQKTGKITISYEFEKNKNIIKISDNGPGISNADMPHIFEPFYTTKSEGEGSGLGLFLCYNYMKNIDGDIEIINNAENIGITARLIIYN